MPGGLIRPAFGVYQTADRAALHEDDGLMPVLAHRSGGQAVDVFRPCRP